MPLRLRRRDTGQYEEAENGTVTDCGCIPADSARRGRTAEDRDGMAYSLGLKGTGLQRFRETRTSATEWAALKLMEVMRGDCKRIEQLS